MVSNCACSFPITILYAPLRQPGSKYGKQSSTCLPLPTDPLSRAFPLLAPLRYKFICAEGPERFELRTSGLGCQVSTITFLTSIVTIFSTLFGVLVLFILLKCAKWCGLSMRVRRGGYVLYPNDAVQWKGDIWVRSSTGWGRWWRRVRGEEKEFEVEEVEQASRRKTGRMWWGNAKSRKIGSRGAERMPLLDSSQEVDTTRSE
jgi:hypothetical protein